MIHRETTHAQLRFHNSDFTGTTQKTGWTKQSINTKVYAKRKWRPTATRMVCITIFKFFYLLKLSSQLL